MTFARPGAFDGAMELKGDDLDPADALTKELASLKDGLDARFKSLETKSAERLDKIEARINRPASGTETKAVSDLERKAFRRFLRGGRETLSADELKTMTVVGDGTAAGYLAPAQYGDELIKLLVQYSPIRSYATVKSIGGPQIIYPRRKSSLSASWVAEIATRTESQPAFEQVAIAPHELATYVDVSNALLEDNAYDLEGELLAEFAEQFGKAEGAAFINGTGGTQPVGLLNSGVPYMPSGDASSIGVDAFVPPPSGSTSYLSAASLLIRFFHQLPAVHAQNGTWLMNRNTITMLRMLRDATGRYLLLDSLSEGAPVTLLGRPIVEAIDMPDVGAGTTPIIFGDLKGYRIVDRVGLSILRDPYSLGTVGQTRFYARKRVGAGLTHPDRLFALKCSVA